MRKWSPWEILLAIGCVLCLVPVVLIFLTAFKPDSEIVHFIGLLPHHWTRVNFHEILGRPEEIPILPHFVGNEFKIGWLGNSIFISSSVTLLVLSVDSLAAYGLARLELPGRKWIFSLIIATMMVPGQILLVPIYLILNQFHWLDTPAALIVPAGAGAFGVFLLHQFFQGNSQGAGRSRDDRWVFALADLLAHYAAAGETGAGDAGDFHIHWLVERFSRAAGVFGLGGKIHATGRRRAVSDLLF